jgi:seryl-tRNA synthetase
MNRPRDSKTMGKRETNPTKKAVLDRIERIEESITKAREYLESGDHAHWAAFQPLLAPKLKDGVKLPPHKDWVKNVFIPRLERALARAEKSLDRLDP